MTPLDKTQKQELTDKITKAVNAALDAPELSELSASQIESIAKKYYIDTLTKEFAQEVKKSQLTKDMVNDLINQWIDGFSSPHTRRSFQQNIRLFLEWIQPKSILEVNAKIVDQYIAEIKKSTSLSDNTIRQRVAACSSFFSALVRWDTIGKNPFLRCRGLPKKRIAIKQENQIPTNKELDALEKYALNSIKMANEGKGKGIYRKLHGNILTLCAVKVLRATGIRIGALQNMIIDKNGYYKAKSKNSISQGNIDNDLLSFVDDMGLSRRQPFHMYTPNAFSVWLWRALTSDNLSGTNRKLYSAHGIRHRFAIDFYNKSKDVHELSKRLGHSSLLVTTAYLSGLKSEIEEI